MWNNYHLVTYGILTTTNSVEVRHRAFSSTVASHHPTIWKFCETLKIEQSRVELKQIQYYSGMRPTKSKEIIEKGIHISWISNELSNEAYLYLP